MIKTLKIISLTLVCSFCATINQAQSTSLDEMYRDLVRSNNTGYLPTYIKNRNAPEFLIDHEQLIKAQENKDIYPEDAEDVEVNFDDKRLVRERIEKANLLTIGETGSLVAHQLLSDYPDYFERCVIVGSSVPSENHNETGEAA